MNKEKFFVSLEGLDGTGKTTVAAALAEHLRAGGMPVTTFHVPMVPFESAKQYVAEQCDINTQFLFHLTGVSDASRQIVVELTNASVICDRYIHSTLAYHRAMGTTVQLSPESMGIRWPDHVFYLTADDERVRRSRIDSRGAFDPGDNLHFVEGGLLERIDEEYRRFSSVNVVETSHLSILEVVSAIAVRLGYGR